MMDEKKIDINTDIFESGFQLSVAAGIAANLAGADIGTAALIGLGLGAVAATRSTIKFAAANKTAVENKCKRGKKAKLAMAILATSIAFGGVDGCTSAVSYKATGIIKDSHSKPAIEQPIERTK